MLFTQFERFEIGLEEADVFAAAHPGDCAPDVEIVTSRPYVREQLAQITDDALSAELKEYGAWEAEQLSDREANNERIIWLAAGNIREGNCYAEG